MNGNFNDYMEGLRPDDGVENFLRSELPGRLPLANWTISMPS